MLGLFIIIIIIIFFFWGGGGWRCLGYGFEEGLGGSFRLSWVQDFELTPLNPTSPFRVELHINTSSNIMQYNVITV